MPKPRKSSGAGRAKRNAGIQQARKNVQQQIDALKHQMQILRQQSLKTIEQTIESTFKNQITNNLQKVIVTEKELIEKAMKAVENPPKGQSGNSLPPPPESNLMIEQKKLTTAALADTNRAVELAVKAASGSFQR